jgi:large subunit ribosomal protein L25
LPGQGAYLALRHVNAVIEIDLNGVKTLAIARETQRNPITDVLQHVDFMIVKRGEKIEAAVPVRVEGEPTQGIAILDIQELLILAEATSIPDYITVSVEGLMDGDNIHVSGLDLPEGVTAVAEDDPVVVTVTLPRTAEEQAEETTAPGQGEGEAASQ